MEVQPWVTMTMSGCFVKLRKSNIILHLDWGLSDWIINQISLNRFGILESVDRCRRTV